MKINSPLETEKQRRFFNEGKNQYSKRNILNTPFHVKREIDRIIEKLKDCKEGLIVDFGAGTGRITMPLLEARHSVLAIDISRHSLKELKSLAEKLQYHSLTTATKFPEDKTFYAIVGADILHHVNLDEYLPKFHTSLRKGGKLIFSEPGAFNPSWYVYLPLFVSWGIERGIINCSYFNLKNKLKQYGFKGITIIGVGILPRPFLNWFKTLCIANDWLGNLPILKLFAYRYLIEAQKDS